MDDNDVYIFSAEIAGNAVDEMIDVMTDGLSEHKKDRVRGWIKENIFFGPNLLESEVWEQIVLIFKEAEQLQEIEKKTEQYRQSLMADIQKKD